MAQNFEQIIDLLSEMKRVNALNADSFDRLLVGISNKLDLVNDNASKDLLKAYVEELKSSVESKYDNTLSRFENIEKALKVLYNSHVESGESLDIAQFSEVFTKNVNHFYTEAKQNKAILSGIESKLSELINNKTDKEDILRTISLLRKDFENLNHGYKSIIDDLNTSMKSILSSIISLDPLKTGNESKEQVAAIYDSVEQIVSHLQLMVEKDNLLEKLLKNVVTSQDLKVAQGVIDTIVEKTDKIETKVASLADKTDAKALKDVASHIKESIESGSIKDDYLDLKKCSQDIANQTKDVKQTLGKVAKDIENLPDTSSIETSLKRVYSKLDNIMEGITASNVKGDMFDLNTSLTLLRDDLNTIKNITEDLNDVLRDKISSAVDSFTTDTDVTAIRKYINEVLEKVPSREDIERILTSDSEKIDVLIEKTDNIASKLDYLPSESSFQDLKNSNLSFGNDLGSLISKTESIDEKLSNLNFEKEFSSLYNKTNSIEDWLLNSKIKETSEDMAAQIHKKAEQEDVLSLRKHTEQIASTLEKLNNEEVIKGMIEELKELIETKFSQTTDSKISDCDENIQKLQALLENYKKDFASSPAVVSGIDDFSESLSKIQENSKENFAAVSAHLNSIAKLVEKHGGIESELRYSISELDGLKMQIADLIQLVQEKENADKTESEQVLSEYTKNVSEFLTQNLQELKSNLESGGDYAQNQLQQGFTYNAELIEEKAAAISSLVKNLLKNYNKKDSESSKLQEFDEKFSDFRQELSLLNTDIIENLSARTEKICDEIDLVRDTVANIPAGISAKEIEEKFLQLSDLISSFESKSADFDSETISNQLSVLENNIRDFVLSDVDSVIIKMDSLKEFVENSIKSIVPPDPEKMQELHDYLGKIEQFQKSQQELIQGAADMIQENMALQHDELKSMISSALDTDNILDNVRDIVSENATRDDLSSVATQLQDNILQGQDEIKLLFANDRNLNEIKESVSSLKNDIDLSNTNIEKLASENNNISSSVQELKDSISFQNDNIKSVSDSAADISQKTDSLSSDISSLSEKMNDSARKLDDVVSNIENNTKIIDAVGANIDNAFSNVDELSSQIENNTRILEDINSNITSAYQSVDDISLNIEGASKNIEILSDIADRNSKNIEFLTDNSENSSRTLEEVSVNVSDIKSRVNSISEIGQDIKNEVSQGYDDLKTLLKDSTNPEEVLVGMRGLLSGNAQVTDIENAAGDIQEDILKLETNLKDTIKETVESFDEIKSEINSSIDDKHQEIKAMLAVALNHENIISTIEDLKQKFEEKLETLSNIEKSEEADKTCVSADYESTFKDLKSEFRKYCTIIDVLSSKNGDIEEILQNIGKQLDKIEKSQKQLSEQVGNINSYDIVEEADEGEAGDDLLSMSSENDFDFIKAFELLQNDIEGLKTTVNRVLPEIRIVEDDSSNKNNAVINSVDSRLLDSLDEKVQEILTFINSNWLDDVKKYLAHDDVNEMIKIINEKVDILASVDDSYMLEDIYYALESVDSTIKPVEDTVKKLSESDEVTHTLLNNLIDKIDAIVESKNSDSSNVNESISNSNEKIQLLLETLSNKIDCIVEASIAEENTGSGGKIVSMLEEMSDRIEIDVDAKMTSMLDSLNQKIDLLSESGGSIADFEEVKDMILEQQEYIDKLEPSSKIDALKQCLDNLNESVNNASHSGSSEEMKSYFKDMKDSLMTAVISIFDQVSFIEESEDIKDFVEERTDEINQNIAEITKQLEHITSSNDESIAQINKQLQQITSSEQNDYSYSMQDIETDLSKMRLALSELKEREHSAEELSIITDKLHKITSSVDSLTQDEMKVLKDEISQLKEQTRFLIVSADKSYSTIADVDFTGKINSISKMLEKSNNSDAVIRKALIYMGEWIDSASENMHNINKASAEIKQSADIQIRMLESLEQTIAQQQNKLLSLEKQIESMENIDEKLTVQEERINRLEMNIDKVLSVLENMDDSVLSSKMDKIEKQMSKLGSNVEKLAAYVD